MKQTTTAISRTHFRPMLPKDAETRLNRINTNPDNSYRPGYEMFLNFIPIIHGSDDPEKINKLLYIEQLFAELGETLLRQNWVHENWPEEGKMLNRVILAIDDATGGEIVLVRWNVCETPVHGHEYGQMIDYLMKGDAKEVNYHVIDEVSREVEQVGDAETFTGMNVLSNGFTPKDTSVSRGAVIHKFIAMTKCITLHFIPEHPRDLKGNRFNEPKKVKA